MPVLICRKCGQVFVDDVWFLGECPKCGASLDSDEGKSDE